MERLKQLKDYGTVFFETVYMGFFAILTVYALLLIVQIDLPGEAWIESHQILGYLYQHLLVDPREALMVIVLFRHIFSRKYDWKEWLIAVAVIWCADQAVAVNRYTNITMMLLLMLGAKEIPFEKLIKIYFAIVGTLTIVVVAGSQMGWIENLVYEVRTTRISFGFIYPTSFAAVVFFLMLWYWYLRGRQLRYAEALLPALLGVVTYRFSDARCSSLLLWALALIMIYHTYMVRRGQAAGTAYRMKSCLSVPLTLSPILCAAFTIGISCIYTSQSPQLLQRLNNLFSARFTLARKGIDLYGFSWWGRYIRMIGYGGSTKLSSRYFFLDSAYLQFALQYGLVILGLLLVLFFCIGLWALKNQQWILLWILALVSVHAVIEPNMLRLVYCPLILAVFADKRRGIQGKHNVRWNFQERRE